MTEKEPTPMDMIERRRLNGKLVAKILEVGLTLGAVEPDATNEHSDYDYISYRAINARLRTLLPKSGLCITPSIIGVEENEITFGKKGTVALRSRVEMNFEITDAETGYSIKKTFFGADQDTMGKSLQQAITSCQKYFEMKLFHISDYHDEDGDSSDMPGNFVPDNHEKKQTDKRTSQTNDSELKETYASKLATALVGSGIDLSMVNNQSLSKYGMPMAELNEDILSQIASHYKIEVSND